MYHTSARFPVHFLLNSSVKLKLLSGKIKQNRKKAMWPIWPLHPSLLVSVIKDENIRKQLEFIKLSL
jgi:hypothetical protein